MAIRFWEIYEETKEKYKLRILAGKNGMDNVTGWVHMLEDETIINRFSGEELAVTTGMKAGNEGWLLRLVSSMKNAGKESVRLLCLHLYPLNCYSVSQLIRFLAIFFF